MSRPTYLTIDLVALAHNFKRVKELINHRKVIAMVKANAYGHGIITVANGLPAADAFGVASLEEAMMLREAGISQAIVLMEGVFDQTELKIACEHRLTLVIHHMPHVEMLEKTTLAAPITIWLKINTGMHRLGFSPSEVDFIYKRLHTLSHISKPIGMMTHFASADKIEDESTARQIETFASVTKSYACPKSLANSAGIVAWPASHADWVRPGLMLYGATSLPKRTGLDEKLLPVMTLSSQIIAITPVKKNGRVGYGGKWSAPEDMLIGVVGVGYGDGYPQFANNGTPTLVNGATCPLVGQVSMDMLTIDLRNALNAKVGDRVILWGEGLPVESVALHTNSSAYEILTRMTPRPKLKIIGA